MEAIDGESNRQGEQAWTAEQGPEKEPPVLDMFDAADTQLVDGPPQYQDILQPRQGKVCLVERGVSIAINRF